MRMEHNLEAQIQARSQTGVSDERIEEWKDSFDHFDKDKSGRLEHVEFKALLRSMGIELAIREKEDDPESDEFLSIMIRVI